MLKSLEMQSFGFTNLNVGVRRQEVKTLSSTYEQLLFYWVTSLPDDTPLPTRAALAKKVRNVAAEVFLSQTGMIFSEAGKSASSERALESSQSNRSLEIPIHTKHAPESHGKQRLTTDDGDTQEPPILSPAAPLQNTAPNDAPPQLQEHAAVSRLRDFVHFESSKITSKHLLSMLSKWNIGQDMNDYVWENTHAAAMPSDEEGAKNVNSQQGSMHNLKSKRERQKTTGSSSQPASMRIRSQGPMPSSQISDGPITMTQPEVGAHGSRKPVKKDRKYKKPGFR